MHKVAYILLVIGGLNWLLVGAIGWDIGELFGGQGAAVSRVIYVVIGLATIYKLATHTRYCKECVGMMKKEM